MATRYAIPLASPIRDTSARFFYGNSIQEVRAYYYCNKAWLDWLASSSSILWCPKNPSNKPILFWASPNAVPILIRMIHLFTEFDEMLEIPRLYISACYYSVQYLRLHLILMAI